MPELQQTRVVLLGTAGGPALKPGRSSPAAAVVIDGVIYIIDCGNGVGQQLVAANLSPTDIRAIFLTHHHSDHNADYGNLLVLSWATGLRKQIDCYGPPLITKLTDLALQYHAYDIETRIADEGRIDPRPLFVAHPVSAPGVIYKDERVTVTAALAHHPPVEPAFAYRFDTPDRSIVFSGDTTACEDVIALAKDADVLVHEVLLMSALDRLLQRVQNASHLREHLIASHTPAAEVGKVADAARVKRLVLTHLVPGYDPALTDEDWRTEVRKNFTGEIIVGRDLMDV